MIVPKLKLELSTGRGRVLTSTAVERVRAAGGVQEMRLLGSALQGPAKALSGRRAGGRLYCKERKSSHGTTLLTLGCHMCLCGMYAILVKIDIQTYER